MPTVCVSGAWENACLTPVHLGDCIVPPYVPADLAYPYLQAAMSQMIARRVPMNHVT